MKMYRNFFAVVFCLSTITVFAQSNTGSKRSGPLFFDSVVKPRMRVIIDNDFGGDPDGLFELVQHLLSPSVEIRAIIGSHLKPADPWDPSKETATHAKQKIEEVLSIMNMPNAYPVY